MRRALIITAALLIGLAIALTVFLLYNIYEEEVVYDDFIYDDLQIDSDGKFSGRFQFVGKTMRICDYGYEIKDGKLFITLKATSGNKAILDTDEDGYVFIEFQAESHIDKIVYRTGSEETELDFIRC